MILASVTKSSLIGAYKADQYIQGFIKGGLVYPQEGSAQSYYDVNHMTARC